jgi:hypothetical protein
MVYIIPKLIGSRFGGFSTRNVEPLARTWIRREFFYSNGHNG